MKNLRIGDRWARFGREKGWRCQSDPVAFGLSREYPLSLHRLFQFQLDVGWCSLFCEPRTMFGNFRTREGGRQSGHNLVELNDWHSAELSATPLGQSGATIRGPRLVCRTGQDFIAELTASLA